MGDNSYQFFHSCVGMTSCLSDQIHSLCEIKRNIERLKKMVVFILEHVSIIAQDVEYKTTVIKSNNECREFYKHCLRACGKDFRNISLNKK